MKNLKKVSREALKSVKGGITPECAQWWSSGQPYYSTQAACLQSPNFDPEINFGCHNACGRWYIQ
ncbi:bacteriocin-like protein [Chryseobacterium sp. MIQD13]|uniref:bacteriocin-like protein n=1 Tax=Chryseobacterium sp. MIQD13 TaxID=3422310 RepID=UPI003D28B27A